MHPAPAFLTIDPVTLLDRFREHPFCTLSAARGSGVAVTHTPVLVDDDGALRFHIANANRIAPILAESGRALLSTLGPHAYISPAWYEAPNQVGTWNYISAEAEGPVEALDTDATLSFLHDLAATFDEAPAWTDALVAQRKMEAMLGAITAYRLVPERLEGTTKLSQNKPADMRERVAVQLDWHPVAGLMRDI